MNEHEQKKLLIETICHLSGGILQECIGWNCPFECYCNKENLDAIAVRFSLKELIEFLNNFEFYHSKF